MLGDFEAMARPGLYYAAKIDGATALALFDRTGGDEHHLQAVRHLETARGWKARTASETSGPDAPSPVIDRLAQKLSREAPRRTVLKTRTGARSSRHNMTANAYDILREGSPLRGVAEQSQVGARPDARR